MINEIKKYNIYSDKRLADFIIELENKYVIKDETNFFNSLVNFSQNKYIPYHQWFKYREGFSHTLVAELLNRSGIGEKEYVIDPFCGSGTTIVESSLQGITGFGIDVNPMSSFISNTKSQHYSNEEIADIKYYLDKIQNINILVNTNDYEDVKRYFSDSNLKQLLQLKSFIQSIENEKIKNILLLNYLSIIMDSSNRKRDGNGLKTNISKIEDVFTYFIQEMNIILKDIQNKKIKTNNSKAIMGNALSFHNDIEKFNKESGLTPGCMIFSPPYANSFDYFESYKLELRLCDFIDNISKLNHFRKSAVRSFINHSNKNIKNNTYIDLMATEIENAIPLKEEMTGKKDVRTRKVPNMIRGYFEDMDKVLQEIEKVLPKNKKCYIIVDQSSYLGKIVPSDLFIAYLSEQYSFEVEEIIKCRTARTSSQQAKQFPYLKNILRESIVVIKKI